MLSSRWLIPVSVFALIFQTCESSFATKDRLRAHMIRHEEKVPCHICGKLLSAAYITDHMRVHNQSQHHACHLCNRSKSVLLGAPVQSTDEPGFLSSRAKTLSLSVQLVLPGRPENQARLGPLRTGFGQHLCCHGYSPLAHVPPVRQHPVKCSPCLPPLFPPLCQPSPH